MLAVLVAAALTVPALKSAPCRIGESHAAATCGTLTVFKDRAAGTGHTIDIHFIDIGAKHPGIARSCSTRAAPALLPRSTPPISPMRRPAR